MFSFRRYFKLGDISYKELAKRVITEIKDDNCSGYAAEMAYFLLFALFPFLLVLTTLIAYVPVPNLFDIIMEGGRKVLPAEAFSLLQDNIKTLFVDRKGGLLSLGLILALWTASTAVVAIMDAMNRVYDVEEGRPFWKVRGLAILLVIGLSFFFIGSTILLIFGPRIGEAIAGMAGLGALFQVLWNILRWPVILFLLIVALAVIYYFSPDVEQRHWRWISPGSVFAIPIWLLMSLGFSYYVNNFGSYNKTYGSIGVVIILLTWLYLSGFIILVGGEINAEIEHASAEGKKPGEKVEGSSSK